MKYDYWFGSDDADRRIKYAASFRPEYQAAGDDVQRRVNAVQVAFRAETGILLPPGYSSGWRPPEVNDATANAAKLSTHMTAQAGDPRDTVDGDFTWYCFRNPGVLERHGVWMEHPIATVVRAWVTAAAKKRAPTPWCHLQAVPPVSHLRCYFPDKASIPEWDAFIKGGGYAGMTFAAWMAMFHAPEKGKAKETTNE